MGHPPPISTLFPYTTLFRSNAEATVFRPFVSAHFNSGSRLEPTFATPERTRSEEHTSELQSRLHLVCRLLLEKKKALFGGAERLRVKAWGCVCKRAVPTEAS